LASLVEAGKRLTIVLAVATVRGWRPAGLGAFAGLVALALIVVALGPLLDRIPLHLLQLAIGVLLLLFGMRWLRKGDPALGGCSLRCMTRRPAFATETAGAARTSANRHETRLDWLAALTELQGRVLRSLEVVFIVIAVSAGRGLLVPASAGALAACLLVAGVGLAVHRPLAQGSRKHAQVRRRRDAVGVRRVLDRRRPWSGLAGRRSRDRRLCGAVSAGRIWRGQPGAAAARGGLAMNVLGAVFRELLRLFVDDGALALEILRSSCLPPFLPSSFQAFPSAAGAILIFGCLGVLLANVARTARRR